MFWAACFLGFFAFLRSGEFTIPLAQAFDPTVHLTAQDVAVDDLERPSCVIVKIKSSKTDQSRAGVSLCVGKTGGGGLLCPVAAILAFLARRGMEAGPLFRFEDSSPLTRSKLVVWLRSTLTQVGIDCFSYSGHSFRIGVATTAAARGFSDSTIQTFGRWESDSFKRYIRIPRGELAKLSKALTDSP